jgi:hypothetical protein
LTLVCQESLLSCCRSRAATEEFWGFVQGSMYHQWFPGPAINNGFAAIDNTVNDLLILVNTVYDCKVSVQAGHIMASE